LIFTAEMVDAHEALRLGLFDRVVPHDDLPDATRSLARTLAAKPPKALALAKRAVYASEAGSLDDALSVELRHQLECFLTEDAREGLQAFLEKRDARFRGA
jgi:enoyl-CoA hydratase/carnithine racemase